MRTCKEQQCTVTPAQASLWCNSECFEACAVMQSWPIFRHQMTRCQPPSHLTLLAKLLLASPLMSFPDHSHVFCSPVILKVTFHPLQPLQLFYALFLGASVRITDESRADWQNQEKESEGGSGGKMGGYWWDYLARNRDGGFSQWKCQHSHTPHPKTVAMTSGDGDACTTTLLLQTEPVINAVVTWKWGSVSNHHSQHKFCKYLGRGF